MMNAASQPAGEAPLLNTASEASLETFASGIWAVLVSFWEILIEAGPWLLIGFVIAGVMHSLIPRTWLERQFGSRGLGSVLRAAMVGVPLPLCSCSVIPAAAGLRRGGASKGASAAFAISTPEVDVPAVSLTWALIGWPIAAVRVAGALVSGVVAGFAIDLLDRTTAERADTTSAKTTSDNCCGHGHKPTAESCCDHEPAAPKASIAGRAIGALRYGFLDMPADLSRWMVIGLLLSAMVAAFIPASLLEEVGSGWFAMLVMLVVGVPFYVCATASTPLAAVLIAKGLDPGAAVVFLLAGPATNPATMAWVLQDLGARSLGVYLASIAVVSLAAGALVSFMDLGAISSAVSQVGHAHGDDLTGIVSGALLAGVLGFGLLTDARKTLRKRAFARAQSAPVSMTISVDR